MLAEKYPEEVKGILAKYPTRKSAILQLMHLAQEEYGYMSPEAIEDVASILGLDQTHVLSLAGFYTLYYEGPVGKYVLEVCTDLACALRGADKFLEMALDRLGLEELGETTEDGLFTLYSVMCLAACDRAPMLQCNLAYVENLDETKFDDFIARLRQEAKSNADEPSVVARISAYAK